MTWPEISKTFFHQNDRFLPAIILNLKKLIKIFQIKFCKYLSINDEVIYPIN